MKLDIKNKVANSGLVTLDLEGFLPKDSIVFVDVRSYLFQDQALKEKEFRLKVKSVNWSSFKNKIVGIWCSVDAIVPFWAYMLISSNLAPFARAIYFSSPNEINNNIIQDKIRLLELVEYKNKKVVVKGCGHLKLSENIYVKLVEKLHPVVKSIMYGEPCSTVPIYKKKNQ